MSYSATLTAQAPAHETKAKPGLFAQMFRLWLEHNQRMIDMRMGPF